MHGAGGSEAETLAVAFEQLVLGDFKFAVPDALHAPQAAVVVDRRALSGRPGHRNTAVAVLGAAIQLAPRVVVVEGFEDLVAEPHLAASENPPHAVADPTSILRGKRGTESL